MPNFFKTVKKGAMNGAKNGAMAAAGVSAVGVGLLAISTQGSTHPREDIRYLFGILLGGGLILSSPFVLLAGIAVGALFADAGNNTDRMEENLRM